MQSNGIKNVIRFAAFALALGFASSCSRSDAMNDEELSAYATAKERYFQGDYESAIQAIDGARFTYRRGHQALLLEAKSEFFRGHPERAERILRALLARYPRYAEAELWHARTLLAEGKTDEAEKAIERAMRWNPDDPRLLALMASLQKTKKDYPKAFEYSIRAADFADETSKAEILLAELYWRFGQNDKAAGRIGLARAMISDKSVLVRPLKELEERIVKERPE